MNISRKWSNLIPKNGICISFGWNSTGLGKKRGFEIIEILLGLHNDTICGRNQVEIKQI
jgi:hypothetical protein